MHPTRRPCLHASNDFHFWWEHRRPPQLIYYHHNYLSPQHPGTRSFPHHASMLPHLRHNFALKQSHSLFSSFLPRVEDWPPLMMTGARISGPDI